MRFRGPKALNDSLVRNTRRIYCHRSQAQRLLDDLAKHSSEDTIAKFYWLPTIRAAIALNMARLPKALWKDADPDIPILKQAKAEYAKLR